MLKIKRLPQKIGSILCIAVIATSVGVVGVSANNNTDRPFYFNFSGIGNKDQYTASYLKTDSTSMYMNCIIAGGSYSAIAYGQNDNDGKHDCAYGDPINIHQGSIRQLYNLVYERKYKYGGIHAYRAYWDGFASQGKFSPDSTPFKEVF